MHGKAIHGRGHLPIVVGGSGFYLATLLAGPRTTPRPEPADVERVRAELQRDGGNWATSLARLERVDPVYAATLSPNDYYRLERGNVREKSLQRPATPAAAADIVRVVSGWRRGAVQPWRWCSRPAAARFPTRGKSWSRKVRAPPRGLQRVAAVRDPRPSSLGAAAHTHDGSVGAPRVDGFAAVPDRVDMRCVFLTYPRVALMRRIDLRCEQMIQRGLVEVSLGARRCRGAHCHTHPRTQHTARLTRVLAGTGAGATPRGSEQEVVRLRRQGLHLLCPAGRAIGYRQTLAYLLAHEVRSRFAHAHGHCTAHVA